ncbi:Transposase, Mutator family [Thermoanaerobacter thermohydrosulfuricus]|uniref:Transposase, Mutator family n=1 Tax=Thermoanaerobacter thermohydrosulfuricus TaxID=1516 RepID=A0A1G7QCF1_THETY|nr:MULTISPECIES: transposase [Thermoanaerobacter]SDF96164.1 Transposase, Mutator family [Thermoanaerobacter thermohydrosulfuricus]
MFCGRSVLIAVGINEDGYREVLGLMIGDSESGKLLRILFMDLDK